MSDFRGYDFSTAINDFHKARRKATMQEIIARLTGTHKKLLSYDEVRRLLKGSVGSKKVLQEIPIESIIGSVNRYDDFTHNFLPRENVDPQRWAKVEVGASNMQGLPPIEVYQIGETYFVIDGNHRVSVAKSIGAEYIQAYVTPVEIRVPVTPDLNIEELIIKHEYANFLERTNLDKHFPDVDFSATNAAAYRKIEEHISVHRYFMGIEQEREITYEEAAKHWFDAVYLPVIDIIRHRDLISDFPTRTETDMYVWIVEHRKALEEEYGYSIETDEAVKDFNYQYKPKITQKISRLGSSLIEKYVPDALEGSVQPGKWRKERQRLFRDDRLFNNILVPMKDTEYGWDALEQALSIAQREDAFIHGITIVKDEEEKQSARILKIEADFLSRCSQVGVDASFSTPTGPIARGICDQSRWYDLTIFKLEHPPGSRPIDKLSSGVRHLVQRCPSLIMAIPSNAYKLDNVLLAYDDSTRAREALYVSTYLAGKWGLSLTVITIQDSSDQGDSAQSFAREYLEQFGIAAQYILESGDIPTSIINTADQHQCNAIIMGGYSTPPLFGIFTESVVDQLLRQIQIPILLCR